MRSLSPWSVRAPWRSRVRMSLQVQKMLSMRWRIGARCGRGPGSSLRRGLRMVAFRSLTWLANLVPA
jgi:hypothetical protein